MRCLVAGVLACSMLLLSGGVTQAAKPKATPEERFNRRDKDRSGNLSEVEFVGKKTGDQAAAAKKIFHKKDKDANGALTLDEFKAKGKGKKKTNA